MPRPSRFQIMELYKNEIITELKNINNLTLSLRDIEQALLINKSKWKLPQSTTLNEFLDFLIDKKKLLYKIEFGTKSRITKRFLFLNEYIDPLELGMQIYPNGYLSHFSAVTYHDLTNEIIKSVYINIEQSPKAEIRSEITQDMIDLAFTKPQRNTQNFLDFDGHRIYFLSGMYTGNIGSINREGIRVTDIERTLIDIVVRPDYSGGIHEVLEIYKRAKGNVSVNRISAYLKKLNYIYPYHQAIGFLLEKADYKSNAIQLIEKFPIEKNFYLTRQMNEMEYSSKWKLFYPRGM